MGYIFDPKEKIGGRSLNFSNSREMSRMKILLQSAEGGRAFTSKCLEVRHVTIFTPGLLSLWRGQVPTVYFEYALNFRLRLYWSKRSYSPMTDQRSVSWYSMS